MEIQCWGYRSGCITEWNWWFLLLNHRTGYIWGPGLLQIFTSGLSLLLTGRLLLVSAVLTLHGCSGIGFWGVVLSLGHKIFRVSRIPSGFGHSHLLLIKVLGLEGCEWRRHCLSGTQRCWRTVMWDASIAIESGNRCLLHRDKDIIKFTSIILLLSSLNLSDSAIARVLHPWVSFSFFMVWLFFLWISLLDEVLLLLVDVEGASVFNMLWILVLHGGFQQGRVNVGRVGYLWYILRTFNAWKGLLLLNNFDVLVWLLLLRFASLVKFCLSLGLGISVWLLHGPTCCRRHQSRNIMVWVVLSL